MFTRLEIRPPIQGGEVRNADIPKATTKRAAIPKATTKLTAITNAASIMKGPKLRNLLEDSDGGTAFSAI